MLAKKEVCALMEGLGYCIDSLHSLLNFFVFTTCQKGEKTREIHIAYKTAFGEIKTTLLWRHESKLIISQLVVRRKNPSGVLVVGFCQPPYKNTEL